MAKKCDKCAQPIKGKCLTCLACKSNRHYKCCEIKLVDSVKGLPWTCERCCYCHACNGSRNEPSTYVRCDRCDREYHVKCMPKEYQQKTMSVSEPWMCPSCSSPDETNDEDRIQIVEDVPLKRQKSVASIDESRGRKRPVIPVTYDPPKKKKKLEETSDQQSSGTPPSPPIIQHTPSKSSHQKSNGRSRIVKESTATTYNHVVLIKEGNFSKNFHNVKPEELLDLASTFAEVPKHRIKIYNAEYDDFLKQVLKTEVSEKSLHALSENSAGKVYLYVHCM